MNEFFEIQKLPKLTQYKTGNLNLSLTIKDTEFEVWNLQKKESEFSDHFAGKFQWIFKGIEWILHNLFQKIKESIPSNAFYEIILITLKSTSNLVPKKEEEENYRPISHVNIDTEILQKILASWMH